MMKHFLYWVIHPPIDINETYIGGVYTSAIKENMQIAFLERTHIVA